MNISIPDQLKGWAESRVAEGRYSSTSDYIRDLVRRDQDQESATRQLRIAIDNDGRLGGTDGIVGDASPDREVGDHAPIVDALRRLWFQGIDSGPPVDGNFDAADVARRGAEALGTSRTRG